jgi:hypothetical protein
LRLAEKRGLSLFFPFALFSEKRGLSLFFRKPVALKRQRRSARMGFGFAFCAKHKTLPRERRDPVNVDPLRDKDLVRATQQGADRLLEDGSAEGAGRVAGLIHRWFGDREDYGRV